MDRYEDATVEFLLRLWQPGELYLDVGANIGLIAIPFTLSSKAKSLAGGRASLGKGKMTFCIEAVDSNIRSIEANIQLNELGGLIDVVGLAV